MKEEITIKDIQFSTDQEEPTNLTHYLDTVEKIEKKRQQDRMQRYKEQKARDKPEFHFELGKEEKSSDGSIQKGISPSIFKNLKNDNDTKKANEQFAATMYAATGSTSYTYASNLFSETQSAIFDSRNDVARSSSSLLEAMISLQPKDVIEGQLCSRLIMLNNQISEFMRRSANTENSSQGVDINVNRVVKLQRVYNETLAALEKYRRKGTQNVVVQHVNVGNGGQAVVTGNLNQGGNNEKNDGENHAQ